MSRLGLGVLLLASFLAVGCSQRPDGGTPQSKASEAPPTPPFPLPLFELSGSPAEIGAAHAVHLSDQISDLHDNYLMRLFGGVQHKLALSAARSYGQKLDEPHRREIAALASALKMPEDEVMLGNCFLDLSPMVTCSTIALPASAAPDGVARFGRNLDFPSLDVADKHTVVLIYRPAGRFAFAAVTWPGLAGVLSGMNEHGLTLANMEVTRLPWVPTAMPYVMLYRKVLEECRTVEEAVALLEKTPRQTANNLMLMDAAGGRAVVEITRAAVVVRRPAGDAALVSTNHQRGEDADSPGRCRRYDGLHAAAAEFAGTVDVARLQSMLDVASQKDFTLQSMIFEPANRVLYLSAGKNAAKGPFHKLNLRPYFK